MSKRTEMDISRYIVILLAFLMVGCGPKHQLVKNTNLSSDKTAKLVIYRPDGLFHKYNPEEPHVFLNNIKIGTLGVGETIETRINPGNNIVKLKDSILFVQAGELGAAEINAVENRTYYVRYAFNYSHNVGVHSVGDSALKQVKESVGKLRK